MSRPEQSGYEQHRQERVERARRTIPELRKFHDLLEDRTMMADPEVAELVAKNFTGPGIEVFSDFVKALEAAKERIRQAQQKNQ
jgi:hypothetical protein